MLPTAYRPRYRPHADHISTLLPNAYRPCFWPLTNRIPTMLPPIFLTYPDHVTDPCRSYVDPVTDHFPFILNSRFGRCAWSSLPRPPRTEWAEPASGGCTCCCPSRRCSRFSCISWQATSSHKPRTSPIPWERLRARDITAWEGGGRGGQGVGVGWGGGTGGIGETERSWVHQFTYPSTLRRFGG